MLLQPFSTLNSLIISLLFFPCLTNPCHGQHELFYFHHINVESKLSQSTNWHVYRDSRNLIWIGSVNGLNCFDGENIKVYKAGDEAGYSLVDNNIQSPFFEDKEGNIWFSTIEAVNCFERKTGKIRIFAQKGITEYRVVGIEGKDKIWVMSSASGNLYILTPNSGFDFKHHVFEEPHWGLLDTGANGAVERFFAYPYNKNGLQINTYKDGRLMDQQMLFDGKDGNLNLGIRSILKEGEHTFWLSTMQGLFLFDAQNNTLDTCFLTKGSDWPNACVRYKKDFLLCAFAKSGLALLHKKSGKLVQRIQHNPSDAHSLAGDNLTNLTKDSQGNLWVSVDGIGVDFANIWQRRPFGQLLKSGPNSAVDFQVMAGAMMEDSKGNILCVTAKNGLLLLDQNKNFRVHYSRENRKHPSLFSNYVSHLLKDNKDRIWVQTYRGLALWDADKERFKHISGLDHKFIFGYQLKNGEILFCHLNGGIYKMIESGADKIDFHLSPEFDTTHYTALLECSDGKLFAAKGNTCVEVYANDNGYRKFPPLPLNGNSKCLWENKQKNEVWAATSNGLAIIDLGTLKHKLLTEKDGLPDRCIHSILAVNAGEIWISTNRGLSKTSPNANFFRNFTYADGLSSYEFRDFASMLRSNGEVWFGSMNGITHFNPTEIDSIPVVAIPQFIEIFVNDTARYGSLCIRTDAQNESEVKNLVLDHRSNTLEFRLAALEYCDPENVNLRYYMHGVDRDTVEFEGHGVVRYPNLPYGQYTFSVWASNSDGYWNPEPRVLEIEILPPFWMQGWFISMCIIAFILLAWYAYQLDVRRRMRIMRLKMERQIAVEQERKRIARDMHDDIGSGLSELGLIAELTKQKLKGVRAKESIEKLIRSSREISGKLRELIWTVYAQNDTLERLISFLHAYASDFFENSSVECSAILPNSTPHCIITGQKRHMILMAFKEALNNVIKHANAHSVKISFEYKTPYCLILIQDDGIGFNTSILESPVGYGLSNMHARMADIDGASTITSGKEGTTVALSFEI